MEVMMSPGSSIGSEALEWMGESEVKVEALDELDEECSGGASWRASRWAAAAPYPDVILEGYLEVTNPTIIEGQSSMVGDL